MAELTEEMVTNPAQALAWISKGESKMLFLGLHTILSLKPNLNRFFWCCLENRHYGKTKMNQRSSRSHTIFRMVRSSNVYMNMWISMDFPHFFFFFFFKDSWKSRKEWPGLWRKCWWSHHCVSFSKSVHSHVLTAKLFFIQPFSIHFFPFGGLLCFLPFRI